MVQAAGNGHNGSASWTYSIADHAFDFLAKGETLVLNYVVTVDDGHGGVVSTPITVPSTAPTSPSSAPTTSRPLRRRATRSYGSAEPGQPNPTGSTAPDIVTGTISFTDVDLTDRPVASASFTSFTYTDAADHALTLSSLQQAAVPRCGAAVGHPGRRQYP